MSKIYVTVTPAAGGDPITLSKKRVKIKKSFDEICHYVEVELPYFERKNIHLHDKLQVRFKNKNLTDTNNSRPVTTVFIDEISDNITATEKTVTCSGRSPARDIIDSIWSGRIDGKPDLLTIVKTIASEFGIEAIHIPTTQNNTKPIPSFSWENESPWTKLLAAADNQGYVITSNQLGNLYLCQVASGARSEGFSITEGINVKQIRTTESGSQQYNKYIVKGSGEETEVTDSTCNNKRILTINLHDDPISTEVLERRAKTEMLRRKDSRIIASVAGWGLSDQQIKNLGGANKKEIFWETNFIIPVKIPSSKFEDFMFISQVEHTEDIKSFSSNITLVNPEVYE